MAVKRPPMCRNTLTDQRNATPDIETGTRNKLPSWNVLERWLFIRFIRDSSKVKQNTTEYEYDSNNNNNNTYLHRENIPFNLFIKNSIYFPKSQFNVSVQ